MLSNERQKEMYQKIAGLGKTVKERKLNEAGIKGSTVELELDVTIPEVLVGLGVAVTEEEAQEFIVGLIGSSMVAAAAGLQNGSDMVHDFVKIGFFIGLLAGRGQKGGVV